jgi:hypothetical protein
MISFEHTKEEVELILKGLQELPHKLVHELLVKIHAQAMSQITVPAVPTVPTDAPAEAQPQAK